MNFLPTVLLHPYVPGLRPSDQAPCWDALHQVALDTAVKVHHFRCAGAHDYARALNELWGHGVDIIICEHDIVPTSVQVMELEICPENFCAFDYFVSKHKCWSQVKGAVGLGLCRFRVAAQSSIVARPRVPQVPWHDLGSALGLRLGPVHLHYPLADHRHHYA